ncbi:MAG: hypothetical protein HOP29_01195 [Phycisphaerales bacterium]|nr:hypothetical protein [Phycisphaerales bacterium]
MLTYHLLNLTGSFHSSAHEWRVTRRFVAAAKRGNMLAVTIAVLTGCTGTPPGDDSLPIEPNPDGTMSTVVGTGTAGFSGDGGPSTSAELDRPMDITVTDDRGLLIADFNQHRVRRVELTTGTITTVAGTGETTGVDALPSPSGVTVLSDGGFLAVAQQAHRVYQYAPDGSRSAVAGNGIGACAAEKLDDPPLETALLQPRNVDVLADGSLLVSDQGCHRVRRIRDDVIITYAGTGAAGYSGDGGPAVEAEMHAGPIEAGPSFGIALSPEDPPDELFIADTDNHVIRQVKPFTGRIETFAGDGEPGFVDGPPDEARFNRPTHVFSGGDHSLWVVDAGNHAIRYVDPLGTRVVTVAGTGSAGFNGDGLPPDETQLDTPTALWVTVDGTVFIADAGNHRVRFYKSNPPPPVASAKNKLR